jgi:hypothetical protein
VDAGSLFAPPDTSAEPEAEAEATASIFPPDPPSKKDADYSQNPAWKRIVKARDSAVLELATMKQRVAELEPYAKAVRDRFGARGSDGGFVAMEFDASFADAFESLLDSDPEVRAVSTKVVAVMNGQTPVKTPASNQATSVAAAGDPRLDAILQRDAQREVSAALHAMGVVDAKVEGMAKFILRNATDIASIDEAQITALGRAYVQEHGLTRGEVMGETNGKTPRRPSSGGSRSATSTAAATEPEEKPAPEFTDRKGYLAFKEKMIRSMSHS